MDLPLYLSPKWIPLAKTAAIKVAIWLWYNEDIRLLECPIQEQTMKRVAAKARQLNLPVAFQRQLEDVVGPIGDHISSWMRSLDSDGSLLNLLNWPKLISWKANGTIDNRKTAERAIRCGAIGGFQVFRLAALNCMADQLFRLWPTLKDDRVVVSWREESCSANERAVHFWMAYLAKDEKRWLSQVNEDEPRTHSPHYMTEFGFLCGLGWGNEEFCLYHMDRLNENEKERICLSALKSVLSCPVIFCINPSLFYRIVCQMCAKSILDLLDKHPCSFLLMLLQWPLQDYFLDTARKIQQRLDARDFAYVLNAAARKAYGYENSVTYENLFVNFWEGANVHQREYYISEWVFKRFLQYVIHDFYRESADVLKTFEGRLKETMLQSGHLVFDVTVGYCYLDIMESVIVKYFTESWTPILEKVQSIIAVKKYSHICSDLCTPKRFNHYVFSDKIYRIVSRNANQQN